MPYQFTNDEVNKIITLYADGMSMSRISQQYSVDISVIRRILKTNNITIKNNNCYKQKSFDKDYFKIIDTPNKAYLLGFIYADGYVTNGTFGIKLGIQDLDFMQSIKTELKSEHKIGIYTNKNGYSYGNQYCMLGIHDDGFVSDLQNLGVVCNKSKVLKFPTENQVPKELIWHFIRGYFDGDGSVYFNYNSKYDYYNINISFVGTYEFLNSILSNIQSIVKTKTHINQYKDKDIYELKFGGRKLIKSIYEKMYDNAELYLMRKKAKFDEYYSDIAS